MRLYAVLIYIFLYAPIALIVFFSFNAGRYAMDWQGFSLEWYGKAFSNPLIIEALVTSLIIAGTTALLSAIIGTLAALGLERMSGWLRNVFDALIYIAIMVPGIVIGISTLIAFVTLFDIVNPYLLAAWNIQARNGRVDGDRRPRAVQHRGGLPSRAGAACGHGPQPRGGLGGSLRHAARHLPPGRAAAAGALHPRAASCWPSPSPSRISSSPSFVAGPNVTLPIYVFSSIRRGVTPEINAVGTVVLLTSLVLLVLAQVILQRGNRT